MIIVDVNPDDVSHASSSQHLDSWRVVAYMPRVVHAFLAAATDVGVYVLAAHTFSSEEVGFAAVVSYWLSWFAFFSAVRPFTNSLEAALSTVGYAAWVSSGVNGDAASPYSRGLVVAAGALAGLAVAARPSAALQWAAVALLELAVAHPPRVMRAMRVLRRAAAYAVLPAVLSLAVGAIADRALYGEWTFPALAFFRFNAPGAGSGASLYGVYHTLWYMTSGLPAVLAVQAPLVLVGLVAAWQCPQSAALRPAGVATAVIAALSMVPHKEHRFLLPVAPLFALYAGLGIVSVSKWAEKRTTGVRGLVTSDAEARWGLISFNTAAGTNPAANDCVVRAPSPVRQPSRSRNRAASRSSIVRHMSDAPMKVTRAHSGKEVRRCIVPSGRPRKRAAVKSIPTAKSVSKDGDALPSWLRRYAVTLMYTVLVATNAGVAGYINFVHQSGPVAVAEKLATIAANAVTRSATVINTEGRATGATSAVALAQQSLMSVHFWMPCHSTPYYATIHAPIAMLQFDCAPHADARRREIAHYRYAGNTSDDERLVESIAWPVISESEAWRVAPELLLRALYGPQPEPPLVCAYRAVQHTSSNVTPVLVRATASLHALWDLLREGFDIIFDDDTVTAENVDHAEELGEVVPWSTPLVHLHPSLWHSLSGSIAHANEMTHATTATGFLAAFGADRRRALTSRTDHHPVVAVAAKHVAEYRDLPTHVVVFDSDAERPQVASYLVTHQYALIHSYFYTHVPADAHARRETREPSRVLLYEHPCWTALARSAD